MLCERFVLLAICLYEKFSRKANKYLPNHAQKRREFRLAVCHWPSFVFGQVEPLVFTAGTLLFVDFKSVELQIRTLKLLMIYSRYIFQVSILRRLKLGGLLK